MIKTLYLQNFQSHKETYLEFHPGVNVIVGDTDSGKSAILRALYWLAFGKPSGNSFIRRKSKGAFVEVDIDDTSVGRLRGKHDNIYFIGKEEYKGFGQSVPTPVSRVLNLSEINFMRQMDPPFLFSKSAGEIAEYLNRLINLDVIGKSLSNINRAVKDTEKEQHFRQQHLLELRKEIKKYSWVDEAEEAVINIEKQERTINRLKTWVAQLTEELKDYMDYQREFESYADTKDAQKRIEYIDIAIENLRDKQAHLTALRKAVFDYKQAQECASRLPNISNAERLILAIERQITVRDTLRSDYTRLNNHVGQYQQCCKEVAKYSSQEKAAMLQLQQEMPDICPLCGQEIE